jgi:hypothetical protein
MSEELSFSSILAEYGIKPLPEVKFPKIKATAAIKRDPTKAAADNVSATKSATKSAINGTKSSATEKANKSSITESSATKPSDLESAAIKTTPSATAIDYTIINNGDTPNAVTAVSATKQLIAFKIRLFPLTAVEEKAVVRELQATLFMAARSREMAQTPVFDDPEFKPVCILAICSRDLDGLLIS